MYKRIFSKLFFLMIKPTRKFIKFISIINNKQKKKNNFTTIFIKK
jgi:hypothetical protein